VTTLDQFSLDLQQEIQVESSLLDEEQPRADVFTGRLIAELTDVGELDDGVACHYEARGLLASGYNVGPDEESLDLFVTIFSGSSPPASLPKADVDGAFRRLRTFLDKATTGLHQTMEESSAAFDMAQRIQQIWPDVDRLRMFLFTDARVRTAPPADGEYDTVPLSYQVWDIERLYRLSTSGQRREAIEIDVEQLWGEPLPCLGPNGGKGDYESYMLVIPGQLLSDIYSRYGARLLELNVRSFLQTRGKVNRGIQETIKNEPERFLAYNNGISITASGVDTVAVEGGLHALRRIRDLQIVNGGQTTASLYHAATKAKANLSEVHVQAKLSVVDADHLESIVPRISEFANSQNKVNTADFSANHPFHVRVEELSRTVWAPAADGSHHMTRWFYERARGQYADELARERTPARQRKFRDVHPTAQRFTKTDLAKYENTWDQLPFVVALGAEKNFREFTIRLQARGDFLPDQEYFERLIGKAILFKRAEKLIGALRLGGYRAQTVTYVLSLIAHRTGQRLDLGDIWRRQLLSRELELAIDALAPRIHEVLLAAPGRGNVGEWAKKPACWTAVEKLAWEPPAALERQLLTSSRATRTRNESSMVETLTDEERAAMAAVLGVSAAAWFQLAAWAKQTDNLQAWQRGLSFSLGRLLSAGKEPSRKQAIQAERILAEARRLGFQETQ
jgi:AIPR protein